MQICPEDYKKVFLKKKITPIKLAVFPQRKSHVQLGENDRIQKKNKPFVLKTIYKFSYITKPM